MCHKVLMFFCFRVIWLSLVTIVLGDSLANMFFEIELWIIDNILRHYLSTLVSK